MTDKVPFLESPAPNLTFVTIGPTELAFSYKTVIAFRPGIGGWVVSENLWGPTTGKHLNMVPGGDIKAARVERGMFEAMLLGHLALVQAGAYKGQEAS